MFHLANGQFDFIFVEGGELFFVDQEDWISCYFFADIIFSFLMKPVIVINLLSNTHEGLPDSFFDFFVVDFREDHGVFGADVEGTGGPENFALIIDKTLDVKVLDVSPPDFHSHFSNYDLSQRFFNDVLALQPAIVLKFCRTVHTV